MDRNNEIHGERRWIVDLDLGASPPCQKKNKYVSTYTLNEINVQ